MRSLCTGCFIVNHGYCPEMGDPETSFAPGACSICGTDDQTVFTLEVPS